MAHIIAKVHYDQAIHRSKSHTQYLEYIERKQDKKEQLKTMDETNQRWLAFCEQVMEKQGQSPSFSTYLNYMTHELTVNENGVAIKKANVLATDNGYQTVSGHEGMFDSYKDVITSKQRQFYQHRFHQAYKEKAILWKPIISFNPEFLEESKILNDNVVNEEKLKQATRQAMDNFIKNNELPLMYWTGMIHYDTDNIHIHVAMVEQIPTDASSWTQDEVKEFAKCSISSFESIKRDMATHLLDRSQQKKELTQHIRQHLIQPTRELDVVKDFPVHSKHLVNKLSAYQYGKLKPHEKAWVNALTTEILHTKFPNEFQEFKRLVKQENDFYTELYGQRKHQTTDYATHLERDVYYRMGNAILKQLQVEKIKLKNNQQESFVSSSPRSSRIHFYEMMYANKKLKYELERASYKAQSKHQHLLAQIDYQNQLQERSVSHGYSLSV